MVESGKHISLSTGPIVAVYVPREQVYTPGATVAVRSNRRPGEALGLIRRTVAGLDPAVTLYDAGSLADHLSLQALPGRSAAGALSGFGLLALLLSATGIYGIVAYAVSLRTREIGIRMAIGAGADDIVRLVVGRVAILLAAGVLAGVGAAALPTPLLMRTLFGAPSSNVFSFVAAALAMAAASAVACWAPARRALAIEPAVALRRVSRVSRKQSRSVEQNRTCPATSWMLRWRMGTSAASRASGLPGRPEFYGRASAKFVMLGAGG